MGKVLAVMRAKEFSPGSVEKDEAVMLAVISRLQAKGYETKVVYDEQVSDVCGTFDFILSMARRPETLSWLQSQDVKCVNAPEGVASCRRSVLQRIMRECNVPMPPKSGNDGYWLKRGDASGSMTDGDVVYVADADALQASVEEFRRRGIDDYVVSTHVKGSEMKFYGVLHAGFFRSYSLTEQRPGTVPGLREAAERLAAAVGVEVYGGDCIVKDDGSFCLIDFNDWPSFSLCRDEAAEAIVSLFDR